MMKFGLTRYQKVFLIRFLGYFLIQAGLVTMTLVIEPVFNEEFKYRIDQLFQIQHTIPNVVTSEGIVNASDSNTSSSTFGSVVRGGQDVIKPVSTDFGIVIEKINANAKIIANVDPSDERAYTQALVEGVAHAKGTMFPGQKGNIYLFSHSVDAPWNIVRFNAIFYLLSKLEPGDRIVIFYQGRRYDYSVFDKAIAKPEDTRFLTDNYETSVLTLQTCDPPGTLLNRLIIRAKIAGS